MVPSIYEDGERLFDMDVYTEELDMWLYRSELFNCGCVQLVEKWLNVLVETTHRMDETSIS